MIKSLNEGLTYTIISQNDLETLIMTIYELKEKIEHIANLKSDPLVYSNKTVKELLGIQDKLLKKYRDDGLLPYHQVGDKYWYTQEDINVFLTHSYNKAYAYAS